jgi:hypothetical protein
MVKCDVSREMNYMAQAATLHPTKGNAAATITATIAMLHPSTMFRRVGPHQRKAAAKAQRRARRAAAKAEKKARVAARKIEERAKRRILLESIKAAGRCCGVLRQPMPFGRAICPKRGTAIRIARPIAPQPTPAARPDSLPQDAAGGSAQTTS